MSPALAASIASALELVLAALREEAQEQPQMQRVKLSVAAEATGIPASTLRNLCARRLITSTRLGRDYLVKLADVETYMERNQATARGPLLRMSR